MIRNNSLWLVAKGRDSAGSMCHWVRDREHRGVWRIECIVRNLGPRTTWEIYYVEGPEDGIVFDT